MWVLLCALNSLLELKIVESKSNAKKTTTRTTKLNGFAMQANRFRADAGYSASTISGRCILIQGAERPVNCTQTWKFQFLIVLLIIICSWRCVCFTLFYPSSQNGIRKKRSLWGGGGVVCRWSKKKNRRNVTCNSGSTSFNFIYYNAFSLTLNICVANSTHSQQQRLRSREHWKR